MYKILRKGIIIFIFNLLLFFLVVLYLYPDFDRSWQQTKCEVTKNDGEKKQRFFFTDPPEENSKRIFFLETSGRTNLKLRESCAVESAARQNPHSPVQVLLFSDGSYEESPSMEVLKEYPNIFVHIVDKDDYFKATPFEAWYKKGLWKNSKHSVAHLSDFIRILSLWKGGGTYLDMDFVVMKDISHLRNFSCTEGHGVASNGVIGLDQRHPVLEHLIHDMPLGYNPSKWSENGPGKLLQALRKVCKVRYIEEVTPENCYGYEVLPPNYFYPVHYGQWKEFFVQPKRKQKDPLSRFEDSYAIHVWNKFSCNTTVQVGSTQIYALAAARYCPLTFAKAATTF